MYFYLLLLIFIFPFSRISAEFILINQRDNTVTLLCQLVSAGDSFTSIIPFITWGDGDSICEFIDIRDELNDGRYSGSHFPDHDGKNLIGNVAIRNFRESDLLLNFKCFQTLVNGTRVEYALTNASVHTASPPIVSTTATHSYPSPHRNMTKGTTNVSHYGPMYIPPCIPDSFRMDVKDLLILVLSIAVASLFAVLLVLGVILRIEIMRKICGLKRRLLSNTGRIHFPRAEYHMPSDTADVPTDGDTISGSRSSQEFYSLHIETEDLSEPAILNHLSNDSSTETPVKATI